MNLSHSLYYECHVTIEPVFNERLEKLKLICSEYNFRVAKLTMEKGPNQKDSFTTGRDKDVNRLLLRMMNLVENLKKEGFEVFRSKIENCILDTNVK